MSNRFENSSSSRGRSASTTVVCSSLATITVTLQSGARKTLEQCDMAKLMRIGSYAPWCKSRYGRYSDKGNDALYQLCEQYPLPARLESNDLAREESIFASKVWLIGRAYAASPERYAYKRNSSSAKPKDETPEGYESFFNDIARILFEGKPCYRGNIIDSDASQARMAKSMFERALVELSRLAPQRYSFTDDARDLELLDKIVTCVLDFAESIRAARCARDQALAKRTGHNVVVSVDKQFFPLSFSSKFLHFHFPKLVFIYDSIAGSCLGSASDFERFFEDGSSFAVQFSAIKRTQGDQKYRYHAIKELSLAKAVFSTFGMDEGLKETLRTGKLPATQADPIPCYLNITRMIDALVVNAQRRS